MPAQGEQHQSASGPNPFEETRPHVSEYTATEIATLASRLEKQLGPEYISSRPGAGGGKVHYLAADKCINLANQVFGFNGWSSSIQQIQIDFVDENQSTGKISLGLSVIVRVTLKDGTFHEDVGYGHIENCKGKAPAFEKAKKEGTTDGLKRALRNFGNLLGNCVYDKDFVARVTKIKAAPTKWDPDNLHRHQDYTPAKKEPFPPGQQPPPNLPNLKREPSLMRQESREDEFGSDDFDEVDFAVPEGDDPDGVTVEQNVQSEHFPRRNSFSKKRPFQGNNLRPPSPHAQNPPKLPTNGFRTPAAPISARPDAVPQAASLNSAVVRPRPSLSNSDPSNTFKSSDSSSHEAPVGFYTARAAESLQSAPGIAPPKAPAFNPHLESPSIRKTAGVDHSQTKPVARNLIVAPNTNVPPMPGPSMANPQVDKSRRVGMPNLASPLQNRGSYKPPQMKRPAEGGSGSRSALGDVTNSSVNLPAVDGNTDAKRQKFGVEALGGEPTALQS